MATAVTGQVRSREGFLSGLKWTVIDSWTIARRHLIHIRYMPEKLTDVTIQPVMFVFMFAYIFGSAIAIPGGNYREFLMPGIFAQTMAFGSMSILVGIVNDLDKGVMDRFRSLPMARGAVLIGHTTANVLEAVLGLLVMTGCGIVVGWRANLNWDATLAAFGILLLFAFAMNWVGAFIGTLVKSVEGAQGIGFFMIFPLTFISNTFVPTQGMPAWLRVVANWNPMSAVVAAVRQLFGNTSSLPTPDVWSLQHPALAAVGWSLLLVCVFLPLAVWRFRRAVFQR